MSQGNLAKRTELRWINALPIIPILAKPPYLASLVDASTRVRLIMSAENCPKCHLVREHSLHKQENGVQGTTISPSVFPEETAYMFTPFEGMHHSFHST